jgi:hypothetical protein
MCRYVRLAAYIANVAILGIVTYMLSEHGWPDRDIEDQLLVTSLFVFPLLNFVAIRCNAQPSGESLLALEIAARKAKLRKRITDTETSMAD